MRFECDSCHAKYKISDAKVTGRLVRFPCRKCENKILIDGRPDDVTVPASPAYGYDDVTRRSEPAGLRKGRAAHRRRASSPLRRRQSSVPPRRPSSVARQMPSAPPEAMSSRAASSAFVGDRSSSHPALSPPLPLQPGARAVQRRSGVKRDATEWHVSVNDVPIGPISLEEMAHKVDAGAVSEYSLVWRDGFDEWRPLAAVPELMSLLYERRSSGPPTRSRFSEMPPLGEAQTAIKETPSRPAMQATSIPALIPEEPPSVPSPPVAPVHSLSDFGGQVDDFLPLADALQPDSIPPAVMQGFAPAHTDFSTSDDSFSGASFGGTTVAARSVAPAAVAPPMPSMDRRNEPVLKPADPVGAFSGFPRAIDEAEPVSVPAAPPQTAVVETRKSSGARWFWALLLSMLVFSGVSAFLVFERYGDLVVPRVLELTDTLISKSQSAAPAETQPAVEAEPSGEAELVPELANEAETAEPVVAVEDSVGDAVPVADAVPAEDAATNDASAEAPNDTNEDATTEADRPVEASNAPEAAAAPAVKRKPQPTRARRARPKRSAPSASSSSNGIKRLTAEEQRLLMEFKSSSSAGVAKIAVKDTGSTQSKRAPLDNKAVSKTVSANKPRLQRCYERAVRGQQSPDTVRMNVALVVKPSGTVSSTDVSGDGPGGLAECMEASIGRWKFPASSEGGPARFPVVFSAN